MKVQFMELVKSASGKYCKSDPNGPIFQARKTCNVVFHIHNPFTGEPTAEQQAAKQKFTQAQAAVKTAMADPTKFAEYNTAFKAQNKYATLRGFIFAEEYKKL